MTELTNVYEQGSATTGFKAWWREFKRNRAAYCGFWVVASLAFVAVAANLIAPHNPITQYPDHILTPPFWQEGGDASFLLGTDAVGRDMLSRLIFGARQTFYVGFTVISISLSVGVALGLLAGYFRGPVESVIMRFADLLWAFPSLLLALVVVTILGSGLFNVMIAISIAVVPEFIRLTRAQVMIVAKQDYVIAARLGGASPLRVMVRTVLPNCLAPLIVHSSLVFSSSVLAAAGLSFLGLGATPPTPEWGAMLSESRELLQQAWWVVTFPGAAILVTVLAINLVGDGLRDVLDPKLRRS